MRRTDDFGSVLRTALLDVSIDVLELAVVVQVLDHLLDVVVLVAHVDQRPHVGKASLLQELLRALRVILVTVVGHALYFSELTHLDGSLNVTEVHFRILADGDDASQEVEHAFGALEGVEQVNELVGADLGGVLLRSSNHKLQVLAQVALEQLLEYNQAVIDIQVTKVLDQPL